jgi:cytoskeletal protein RodZ
VSIGATLAAARRRAGLTVSEVSDRTRVRETIIQGIERDDYAVCGGDFYARGHIRAIARAVGEDPQPLVDEFDAHWGSAKELTAAEAFQPVMPLRTRERRRVRWTGALAVVVLAILGFASYKFISDAGHPHGTAAAAAASQHSRPHGASPGQGGQAQSAAASTPSSRPSSPSPSPAPAATRPLAPAGVAAFGPGGTADGDDPQSAALALGGDPGRPWHSSWYTTARFGNLKDGTGLLVDMGRAVTVSSVRVRLGNPGADLELRAGRVPALAGLPRVASSFGAGGTVQFRLARPPHVQYLLLWFTRLPPDNAGTYQATVWKIGVQGRPLPSRHEP